MARKTMATRNSDSGFLSKIFKNAVGNPVVRNVALAATVAIGGVALLNNNEADQAIVTNIETSDGKEIIIEMDGGKYGLPQNFRARAVDAETIQENGFAEKMIDIEDLLQKVNTICRDFGNERNLNSVLQLVQDNYQSLNKQWKEGRISKEDLDSLTKKGGLSDRLGELRELSDTEWYLRKMSEAVDASDEISDADKIKFKTQLTENENLKLERGNPDISCTITGM